METKKSIILTLKISTQSLYVYLKNCREMGFTTDEIMKELTCLCNEIEYINANATGLIKKVAQIRNAIYKYIRFEKTADRWYVRYIYKKFKMGDGKIT